MSTPHTASIIDGNALSAQLRADAMRRADALKARGITPGLAVLLVGENSASQVYVRNKVKACADAGLHSVLERYEADMTEAALLARIDALNKDPAIHGILVQLPVPKHIDANKVIEAIAPEKRRRWFSHRQRRCFDGRPARLSALHALWMHEDARIHRLRPAR